MSRNAHPVAVAMFLSIVIVSLASSFSCAGHRPAEAIPDTRIEGLPPMPRDLINDVYFIDTPLSVRCAEVPTGLDNCLEWLRREADRGLSQLLDRDFQERLRAVFDLGARADDVGPGAITQNKTYLIEWSTALAGRMAFRKHESPLFFRSTGPTYYLRTIVARDEADWRLYSEAIESAEQLRRPQLADAVRKLRHDRFGEQPPSRSRIDEIERRIADHYATMWESGLRDAERRRDGKEGPR